MSEAITLGFSGKVYIGTVAAAGSTRTTWGGSLTNGVYVGAAPGGLTEASVVRSVKNGDSMGEADGTTRASGGFKLSIQALQQLEPVIEMPWAPGDTTFQAFKQAYYARQTIPVAILDGPSATNGSSGVWFDAGVFEFPREEPEDKEMSIQIKLKPVPSSLAPQAVQVA